MASLPAPLTRYVVFKGNTNNKYLALVKEGKEKWFIKACEDSVSSPLARFEVVSPTKEEYQKKGYVHIKSWYNNRFLRCDQSSSCLAAVANEPEEDITKWTCTLFEAHIEDNDTNILKCGQSSSCLEAVADGPLADEPEEDITKGTSALFEPYIEDNDTNIVKLRRVQIGNSTSIHRTRILNLETEAEDPALTIRDYNSVAVLPSNVAFRGDNNKFLCTEYDFGNTPYIRFIGDDMGHSTASFEVLPSKNADIPVIKSTSNDRYWIVHGSTYPEYRHTIRPTQDYDTVKNNAYGWFKPVQLDDTTVALQNWGGSRPFCVRAEGERLFAKSSTITNGTKLVVFEAVVRSTVTNVNYDIDNASIYDITDVTLATIPVQNNTSSANSATLQLQYEDSTTSTFTRGCTFKVSVETKFQTGIPFIAKGQITVGTEIGGDFQWSSTTTKTTTVTSSYTVNIPPHSAVTVSAVGKRGTCNVPFSYTQHNVLYNGQTQTKVLKDGMYKGSNYYNITFVADEAKKL